MNAVKFFDQNTMNFVSAAVNQIKKNSIIIIKK